MLRANLSTRPFYNERAVQLLLLLAGVIVVALTVFNISRILSLSNQNTGLSSRVSSDRAEAQRLRGEAAAVRRGINQAELKTIVAAAQEANMLIDQRTFSWTEFFNHIEETLPPDVMLTEVKPSFQEEQTIISMTVLGRRAEDVEDFIVKLEETGAFDQVLPKLRDETENGLTRVLITAVYQGNTERSTTSASAPANGGGE